MPSSLGDLQGIPGGGQKTDRPSVKDEPLSGQRKLLVLVLGTLVLMAFAYALYRERNAIGQMSRLGVRQLCVMSGTVVLNVLINGCATRLYLSGLGIRLSVWEAFWLSAVTFLCSYLPMHLNLLIRAKYLKQLHALPYGSYTAMVLTNLGVVFCAIGGFGILSLVFLWWRGNGHSLRLYVVFALCAILPVVVGALVLRWGLARFLRPGVASDILLAVSAICRPRKRVALAVGLIMVALFVWSLRFYQAAQHVSPDSRLQLAMVLPPVATLSTYIAVTPSGLGIRELVSSGLTEVLGMDHSVGLAVTTIERAVSVVWFAVLGLVGTLILGRRFRKPRPSAPT
jgi:uncharacterized membrane protein YbhN (UPF0104 family)